MTIGSVKELKPFDGDEIDAKTERSSRMNIDDDDDGDDGDDSLIP